MRISTHILNLQKIVQDISSKIVEEKITNINLDLPADSVYVGQLYQEIESLQVAIILLTNQENK
jgi:tRNA A58 N-methylase Trm61